MRLVNKLFVLALIAFACVSCENRADSQPLSADQENVAALTAAKQNIEKFRKGDASIKVVNSKNVKNLQINIRQISHDFKFGCYLKIDDLPPAKLPAYEKHFKKLFNFAVIGTYWDVNENLRGEQNWLMFEREVELAEKNNWRIEAAPILWGTNKSGTPAWLPKKRGELLPVLDKRVGDFFEKYRTKIQDVELINEPLAYKPDVFALRVGDDYIDLAYKKARETAPESRLMINEYGVFGSVNANNYNSEKYFDLIKKLDAKNIKFDIVGIQSHANREWYSPADIAAKLARYAELGKPIQISEFSVQTKNYENRHSPENILGDYREGVWSDEKQAEFYREFYTVAFGNPQVEAIVQWGLDDERAWLPGIGLIDKYGEPKANYEVLDELINREWRTVLEVKADKNQEVGFRGFFGNYEIQVVSDGKVLKSETVELRKNAVNDFVLKF